MSSTIGSRPQRSAGNAQREDPARHVHHDILDAPPDRALPPIVVPRLRDQLCGRDVELDGRKEEDEVEPEEPAGPGEEARAGDGKQDQEDHGAVEAGELVLDAALCKRRGELGGRH